MSFSFRASDYDEDGQKLGPQDFPPDHEKNWEVLTQRAFGDFKAKLAALLMGSPDYQTIECDVRVGMATWEQIRIKKEDFDLAMQWINRWQHFQTPPGKAVVYTIEVREAVNG